MSIQDLTHIENLKGDMESTLNDVNIEDVRSEGMTIRIGGKVVKFQVSEESTLPEEEIRAEYSEKLTEKLQQIKSKLNEKMSELSYMVEQNRQDFEEKERELQQRLSESNLMPDITYEQAKAGLSVVKGHKDLHGESDVMTWLYQGVYWPKYVDGNPIDPKYSKRLISPVTLEIVTIKNRIRSVTVRKVIGLSKFQHYHSMRSNSDCWGQWKIPSQWDDPNDILSLAQYAMGVLENVNTSSPGNRSPKGLPRLGTLTQHVILDENPENIEYTTNRADERSGINRVVDRGDNETRGRIGQVWST